MVCIFKRGSSGYQVCLHLYTQGICGGTATAYTTRFLRAQEVRDFNSIVYKLESSISQEKQAAIPRRLDAEWYVFRAYIRWVEL